LGMFIRDFILKDLEGFRRLCIQYQVSSLYVIGSAGGNHFNEDTSDIDLLVDVNEPDPLEKGDLLLQFWDSLEVYFKRKVDLLTEASLTNPYLRKQINATKKLIYDGRSAQVFV
jgi:predicted nucleotidyltransferase